MIDGLDGVYNEKIRLFLLDGGQDDREIGLGEKFHRGVQLQALGAHGDLLAGFLSGNIQHIRPLRQPIRHLQKQRGFADARLAPGQHDAARHNAAAQHTVQLADARLFPGGMRARDFPQLHGFARRGFGAGSAHGAAVRRGGLGRELFFQRVPAAAIRAFAHPLGAFIAALCALIKASLLCHYFTFAYLTTSTSLALVTSYQQTSPPLALASMPREMEVLSWAVLPVSKS